MTQCGSLPAGQ